jgi:hypothetical protein
MNKKIIIPVVTLLIVLVGCFALFKAKPKTSIPAPTSTEEPLAQLSPEQYPQITLDFSSNGHFVTVNITNLHASALEYNLVYEAVVKKTKIQTGVSASTKLDGATTYTKEQLLGSESSGKFTYHTDIQNGQLELTLRDSAGRSTYSATYPFIHSPGKAINLDVSI